LELTVRETGFRGVSGAPQLCGIRITQLISQLNMKKTLLFSLAIGILLLFHSEPKAQGFSVSAPSWKTSWGNSGIEQGLSVTNDAFGNTFATGFFAGTVDFEPGAGVVSKTSAGGDDAYITKHNSTGLLQWVIAFGSTSGDYARCIVMDPSSNIYVGGDFSGTVDFDPTAGTTNLTSAGGKDAFMVKYSSSGVLQWVKQFGGSLDETMHSIKINGSGEIYAAGVFRGTADFDPGAGVANLTGSTTSDDAYVLKLNNDGTYNTAVGFGGTGAELAKAIAFKSSDVVVVGSFSDIVDFDPGAGVANLTSAGGTDAFVLTLTSSLGYGNVGTIGGSGNEVYNGVTVDALGFTYLVGNYNSCDVDPTTGIQNATTLGADDIVMTKLTPGGAHRWSKTVGFAQIDYGVSVLTDAAGYVYFGGKVSGPADLDPNAGMVISSNIGGDDIFLLRLDSLGAYKGHNKWGSTNHDTFGGMNWNGTGKISFTGSYGGTMSLSPLGNLLCAGAQDAYLFTATTSCLVAAAPVPVESANHVCPGALVKVYVPATTVLGASDHWQWYTGGCGVTPLAIGDTIYVNPLVNTGYQVRGEGGCASTSGPCGSKGIFVEPAPATSIAGDTNLCDGESTTLVVSVTTLATALHWSGYNSSTITFTPTQDTTLISYAENNGCIVLDTVNVHVYPDPVVTIAGDLDLCAGESTTLTATGASTYLWASGETTAGITASPTTTTTYSVTGDNGFGCTGTAAVSVTVTTVDAGITNTQGVLAAVQNGATYQWIDCGTSQPIAGQTSQSYTPTATGSYAVEVTMGGCIVTSSCEQVTIATSIAAGNIPGLKVYPNPVHDRLVVDASEVAEIDRIEVYTLVGELVVARSLTSAVQSLDLAGLQAGVYTLKIYAGEKVQGAKVVKQ
jgi:hypothetical protein